MPEPAAAREPLVPHMSEAELALFTDTLEGVRTYLEFGAGGSTAHAIALGIPSIWSVESDPAWLARLAADEGIAAAIAAGRVHLVHGDIGPTEAWGYPAGFGAGTLTALPSATGYHAGIWSRLDPHSIDLVLVDGRYRVATALAAVANCRPDAKICVHDFFTRRDASYAPILEFAEPVASAETLAVLVARPGIDAAALAAAREKYACDLE